MSKESKDSEDLSNNTKYIKFKSKSEKLLKAIENKNLWFVHSTEIYNPQTMANLANHSRYSFIKLKDVLNRKNILEIPTRPALNQSINSLVWPFSLKNIWDCRKYIFVAPMSEFIGELYMGTQQDYLTLQPHVYTKESFLLVPYDEVKQVEQNFPKLKSQIVGYHYPPELKDKTGEECYNALKTITNKKDNIETPRYAVELLFDELEKRLGIDIWRVDREYQWPHNQRDWPDARSDFRPSTTTEIEDARPKPWSSTAFIEDGYSYRVDKNNTPHNIDDMLDKFEPLIVADATKLELLGKLLNDSLNRIFRNIKSAKPIYFLSENFINKIFNNELYWVDKSSEFSPTRKCCFCYNAYAMNMPEGILALKVLEYADAIGADASKQITRKNKQYFKYNPEKRNYLRSIVDKAYNIVQYMEILNNYKNIYARRTEDFDKITNIFKNIEKDGGDVTEILRRLTINEEYRILPSLQRVALRFKEACDGPPWEVIKDMPEGSAEELRLHQKLIEPFRKEVRFFIERLDKITEKFNEELESHNIIQRRLSPSRHTPPSPPGHT